MKIRQKTLDSFWSKVDKSTECWEWTADTRHNYGCFSVREGKDVRKHGAHRFSWMIANGAIPNGKIVMHECDNPRCVNPSHLKLGTQADNMTDKVEKGRQCFGVNHGQAKLTECQVLEIFDNKTDSKRGLARLYRVDPRLIDKIQKGDLWKRLLCAQGKTVAETLL